MADNFGFGNFKTPTGIQETKINPAKLPAGLIPNRRLQAKQASSKDKLLAAGLGAIVPFAAEAALSKIPGLEGLLYKQNIPAGAAGSRYETPQQAGKVGIARGSDNPLALPEDQQGPPVPKISAFGTLNPIEEEFKKRQALINKALPSRALKQKSMLGRGLTTAASFLPGAFLDDDESGQTAAAYINSVNAGLKTLGQKDAIDLDNYLKTETKRGEKLLEAADLTAATYFTSIPNEKTGIFENISRSVRVAKDGTKYIKSQGRAGFDDVLDSEGNSHTVPKDSFFIKETEFLSKEAPVKDEVVGLVVDANNPDRVAMGYKRSYIDKNGKQQMQFLIADPLNGGILTPVSELNKSVADGGRGTNWVIPPSNYFKPQQFAKKVSGDRSEALELRNTEGAALGQVGAVGKQLHEILVRAEKDPNILSGAGKLRGEIEVIKENINSLNSTFQDLAGMSLGETIQDRTQRDSNQNDNRKNYAYKLYVTNDTFLKALQNPNATSQDKTDAAIAYRDALISTRDNARAQGVNKEGLSYMDENLSSFRFLDANDNFIESETDRSLVEALSLKLAYFSAGQDGSTGTALSDTDLINYMTQIGYNAKLPSSKKKVLETFVANQFSAFDDDNLSSQLVNASINNSAEDIAIMDRHLQGTGVVSLNTLQKLRDSKTDVKEREKIADQILIELSRKFGPVAEVAYVYDPKRGRIVWNDVGRFFKNNRPAVYQYWNDIFQKKGRNWLPTPRSSVNSKTTNPKSIKETLNNDEVIEFDQNGLPIVNLNLGT